jgi:hypothetical protein
MKKDKKQNFIIVRIMENGKCIHAHEITNLYGELAKYTKQSYPNEAGGYTTIVEIPVKPVSL